MHREELRTPRPTEPARLVMLLALVVFINYIDRGNLATALPLMQSELHLSASQLGVLLSVFYYGYVVAQPPVGWLTERYGAHVMLALGVTVWSAATVLTGFASTFLVLLTLRLLLGIGESAAFPCASKLFAQSVEVDRLGLANGIFSFGYLLGPAVGTLVGGLLMSAFGWRPVFIIFGCISLTWLWPWRSVTLGPTPTDRGVAGARQQPSIRTILKQRALWGTAIGLFAGNYSFYFILAWLPFYLVKARGFSIGAMAWTASWAYLLNALSALSMGWFTDRLIRAGRSPNMVYKGVMALYSIGGILCMSGIVLLPVAGSIAALVIYEILAGVCSPAIYAIPQIIAGPTAAGRWVGIQNASGGFAGLLAPAVTGILVDQTGGFGAAFALAAMTNLVGLAGWVFILPQVAPLRWTETSRQAASGDLAT